MRELLPQEGQVNFLEEAGVGWGQMSYKEGKGGRQAGQAPAPFILAAPYLPGPRQRSLNGPESEQGRCQC